MGDTPGNILSTILKKRVEALGYSSLKKFHADRKDLGCSYELLRQVAYGGRIPRSETLQRILHAMRFSPAQSQKILEMHYRGYVRPEAAGLPDAQEPEEGPEVQAPEGIPPEAAPAAVDGSRGVAVLALHDPAEIASSLNRSLAKIPFQGHEDFWDILRRMAQIAERKAQEVVRRKDDQPLLFEKEPEAIYQYLVRRGRVPSYMSKGENIPLAFSPGIDYRDRFRGALLGAAVGEALGRPARGLSPRDVRELYGRIEGYAPLRTHAEKTVGGLLAASAPLLLARTLLAAGHLDPEKAAFAFATAPGRSRTLPETEAAGNLIDRGFPWYEAGTGTAESLPAARIVPIALLRAADFRRLKIEAGIVAAITHPNAAAIAGAVVQAAALGRLLHTAAGTLDVLGFARGIVPVISGMEPERAPRSRHSRQPSSLLRRLGTELAALLLRRAEIDEIRETLGNGPAVQEGLPFAWACFLRSADDFAEAVLPAANSGNDAECTASLAGGLCGAYLGASKIPRRLIEDLPERKELEAAADGLLALARREPDPGGPSLA